MALTKVRVALCQINTTIGDFIHNVDKMAEFLQKAGEEKAELAVFPELCLSSYSPLDLLDRRDFLEANAKALETLQAKIAKIENSPETVVFGSILPNPSQGGRSIQNAAVVIHKKKIAHTQAKRLLPTYDVFDEARYFEPGTKTVPWASPWGKLGLAVCEDGWFEDLHQGRRIYSEDPALALKGADLVVNISSSPFEINKRKRRKEQIAGFVRRTEAPVIYVNQVGANDEILFDGASLIYSADGEVLFEMPSFREGIAVVDLELSKTAKLSNLSTWTYLEEASTRWEKMFIEPAQPPATAASQSAVAELAAASQSNDLLHRGLVVGIRDYFRKTGFKKAVLGLSGGIDSAVVAALAAEALGPRNVLGVAMPSQYSSSHSLADSEELAKNIGLEFRVHSLKFIFTALLMELKPAFMGLEPDATEENIQARLRGMMLMAIANKRGALVLTTGNKSELAVGYCTTYGDMAGALAPLGDVYKTKVYALAKLINARNSWIPQSTLTKPPSAELRPNQKDQDSLGSYDVLDRMLEMYFEGQASEKELIEAGFEAKEVAKILTFIRISEFKRRQAAPVLKVTSKAFGLGRRVPIAKRWKDGI